MMTSAAVNANCYSLITIFTLVTVIGLSVCAARGHPTISTPRTKERFQLLLFLFTVSGNPIQVMGDIYFTIIAKTKIILTLLQRT